MLALNFAEDIRSAWLVIVVFEGDLRFRIEARLPQDFRKVGIQGMFVRHCFVFAQDSFFGSALATIKAKATFWLARCFGREDV